MRKIDLPVLLSTCFFANVFLGLWKFAVIWPWELRLWEGCCFLGIKGNQHLVEHVVLSLFRVCVFFCRAVYWICVDFPSGDDQDMSSVLLTSFFMGDWKQDRGQTCEWTLIEIATRQQKNKLHVCLSEGAIFWGLDPVWVIHKSADIAWCFPYYLGRCTSVRVYLFEISQRIHVWFCLPYSWLIFTVNVGKYAIHGSYGYRTSKSPQVSLGQNPIIPFLRTCSIKRWAKRWRKKNKSRKKHVRHVCLFYVFSPAVQKKPSRFVLCLEKKKVPHGFTTVSMNWISYETDLCFSSRGCVYFQTFTLR